VTIFLLIKRFHGFPLEYAATLFSILIGAGIASLLVEYWWEGNLVVSLTVYPLILLAGLAVLYLASSEVRALTHDLRSLAQRRVPAPDPL
jgi:phosphate/sulfate permease